MAVIPTYTPTRGAGVDFTDSGPSWSTASAGGDTFSPSPDAFLVVRSTNTATVTVTVTPAAGGGPLSTTISPLPLAPVVAANTGRRVYGPFPQTPFMDPSDGMVHISYNSSLGVQVSVLNFGAV